MIKFNGFLIAVFSILAPLSASGGTIYGGNDFSFFSIDPATGLKTTIGANVGSTYAMAFDPTSGTLYGGNDFSFFSIDPATGLKTTIGANVGSTYAMAFDPTSGTLYGGNDFAFFSIDPATGLKTTIGASVGSTYSMEFVSRPVPEPSSFVVLFAISLFAIRDLSRRRDTVCAECV